ncbi:MAG: NAD(P)-dependent oxidoreductase, partial [Candidatus Brocadiia bacterium]|nr:NAD(P)-dependent oxidoreductase [Candidatus Brocadiia bacterium]
MPTVLIADKLAKQSVDVLRQAGLEVINRPGLTPEQLKEAVRGVEGAIVRSGAKFTADVLAEAGELKAVCRAGVGVDNIDVAAASRQGVVVMNTPGANTISTAEHTIALMLALSRNVGPAYLSMREGRWDRKKFMGAELAATTLGVVGLGRVGRAVAARAAAFDMKIAAYDPYISREAAAKLGIKVH